MIISFDRFEVHKVLVVAPLRVARDTWSAEIEKWEHLKNLRYSVVVGTAQERISALSTPADIYIINRENIQWLVEESGLPLDYDMAGVPAGNGLMDLFAEFKLLDMGERLGRFIGQYRNTYFQPDKRNGMVIYSYKPLPDAEQRIYDKISDITISMKAADHLTMPELISSEYTVQLSDKEREKYERLKKDLVLSDGNGEITAANAAPLSNKLSQMANGAVEQETADLCLWHTGSSTI